MATTTYDSKLARRIVGEFYEKEGFKYCVDRIPGATKKVVQNIASRMGKRMPPEIAKKERQARANARWGKVDALIKDVYHHHGIDVCLERLKTELNLTLTRKALQSRASKLGVRMCQGAYEASREGIGGPHSREGAGPVRFLTELTEMEKLALCGGKRKKEKHSMQLSDPQLWRRI